MLLYRTVQVIQEIENQREIMYQLATTKGFTNPDTIKTSQHIDELIIEYQRIVLYFRN